MYKIDNATAAAALPTPGAAGTGGFFIGGDPEAGTPATVVDADWLNAVQGELVYIITQAGLALSKTDRTQLYQAVQVIAAAVGGGGSAPDASTSVKGILKLASDAMAIAGTDTVTAVTPHALAAAIAAATGVTVPDASTTVKGIVKLATGAMAIAGTDTATAVTPAGVSAAINAAIDAGTGGTGFAQLAGGNLMQWGREAIGTNISGTRTITFDTAFGDNPVVTVSAEGVEGPLSVLVRTAQPEDFEVEWDGYGGEFVISAVHWHAIGPAA